MNLPATIQSGGRFHQAQGAPALRGRSAWQCGAILGLGGGLLSVLFGLLFTLGAWTLSGGGRVALLQTIGTALLLSVIPLLIFGAHCLDLMERAQGTAKGRR